MPNREQKKRVYRMEFNYETRKKYEEKCFSEWEKQHPMKRMLLSKELSALMEEFQTYRGSTDVSEDKILKFWREHSGEHTLSKFMKKYCKPLVELYVPKAYLEDYYSIIDAFQNFQYTSGSFRRTLRSKNPEVHIRHAFGLLYSYMVFSTYKVSIEDYLMDKLSPVALDYKQHDTGYYYGKLHMAYFDDILAARINAGDTRVLLTLQDAFLSENNTVIVTTDMIRAIVKSSSKELHELLAKFLVAARLQEGVRQAVCENADCGTPEAFMTILDAICDENLIRFSAVKRAIATWTGICDENNMDRISDKLLMDIRSALRDLDTAKQMTETNDSIHIMIGLYGLGFYEAEDAIAQMENIASTGTKNQLLTISYYNRMVQNRRLTHRIAAQIFERYPEDYELLAAYMPTYMENLDYYVRESCKSKGGNRYINIDNVDAEYNYLRVPVEYLFENEQQARKHYEILKSAAEKMKKRKQEYSPCIFPWYSVTLMKSDFIARMSLIAYALQDQDYIDEMSGLLSEIDGTYSGRSDHIRMLLHDPKTETQRKALISYVADKETYARKTAYALLCHMTITDAEYEQLEGYLKYKTESIRQFVLKLLEKREESELQTSIGRLLSSKQENMRLAGLDLVKSRCQKEPDKQGWYAAFVKEKIGDITACTAQENILIEEIQNGSKTADILFSEGYGVYDPKVTLTMPEQNAAANPVISGQTMNGTQTGAQIILGRNETAALLLSKQSADLSVLKDYFSLSTKELDKLFLELTAFVDEHAKDEYVGYDGDTKLLGNGLYLTGRDYSLPLHERYPFPELWKEFYDTVIKTPKNFWHMRFALEPGFGRADIKDYAGYLQAEKVIFSACSSGYDVPDKKYLGQSYYRNNMIYGILTIIESMMEMKLSREVAAAACIYAASLPENRKWYEKADKGERYYYCDPSPDAFVKTRKFESFTNRLNRWDNEQEFAQSFYILYQLDKNYDFQSKNHNKYSGRSQRNFLSMYFYVKAYTLGMIPADLVYKTAFETLGLSISVEQLGIFMKEKLTRRELYALQNFMPVDLKAETIDKSDPFYQAGQMFYKKIVDTMLDVELKRGDSPTVFSEAIRKITCVYGLTRLMPILTALGKDTLDRNTYYYWGTSGTGKRECLSHLLQVCYPLEGDGVEELAKEVKARGISKERLIETAMYAPQWMDLVENYLQCDGFKSGCYYFMAHMNERFDDKKKAMIAKYTPLTPEELNDGCFDVDWFFEAYEKLGKEMFDKLYKAAKYISDGNKHSRARKYADAALGKITRDELEKTIEDKRNKDYLMSYGILPISDEGDQLHRYEFLQKFLKESKQFGAQRRASEAKAVETAMKNLATAAGYADELRLTLAMETALVTSNVEYFEGIRADDYTMKIVIDLQGKAELQIEKAGSKLKSVPAALKKNDTYLRIRDFAAKLKNQYSRCVQMFERAMEEQEVYSFAELKKLCSNPVTEAILSNLVYIVLDEEGKETVVPGMLQKAEQADASSTVKVCETIALKDINGNTIPAAEDGKLRVAHPFDLYQAGVWSQYQKLMFVRLQETGRKQPFKQVFRELYVKLPEEMEADKSRMFAGNQIQPAKTAGALKNRRWIADYENGLQKIYYKQNIIATIYAMADWFSPADTEEPTLEYVVFYDRKTFRTMKMSEVPDIVYSEVMRDTDLAVSVAHAGGVDPLTSHSTMEMRRVIAAYNLELFGLTNVTLEGTHAFVKGSYAEYSIHLGSGVIHQVGGHQINVLPVHAQRRGKLFLPFLDDDPKTAEIMSKILLFAQDNKIKDPYIMEQIIRQES